MSNAKIHPSAKVDPTVKLGSNVEVGPYCVLGENVSIGDDTKIMAFVNIEHDSCVGKKSVIFPFANIYPKTFIDDHVTIDPFATLGSNGFGYATDQKGEHHFIPQIGTTYVGQKTRLGSHTFLDRAALDKTSVGEKSLLGPFSHVAHNSQLGKNTRAYHDLIVAGSTQIGNNFTADGKVAVAGHIHVCKDVHIKSCSAINNSEDHPGTYQGFPHQEISSFQQKLEALIKLAEVRTLLRRLKERI